MQSVQNRQKAVLKIIGKEQISSQEELLARLQKEGIQTTQATLSRDLKALHIIKVPGEGYQLPHNAFPSASTGNTPQGIINLEFSGQFAVIKTLSGFASAVASFIDRHPSRPIMGTLAGDDTVLLLLRQGYTPQECMQALESSIPNLSRYLIQ